MNYCPICKNVLNFYMERYPRKICGDCEKLNITDLDGNHVYYENEDLYGGFISIHIINGKKYVRKDNYCVINNIMCFADEARFGGIVIQAL
jgi:hypothetical protein